jgi:type VI secretion system protein ImpC
MANTETQAAGAAAAEAADGGLLDQILTQSKIARSDTERTRARDLIAELVSQVSDGAMVVSEGRHRCAGRAHRRNRPRALRAAVLGHACAGIPAAGRQLARPEVPGRNSETSTMLKIKVFNTTKKELVKDFKSASDFDQSTLFKKLYEEEYGTFGGAPFATLIGDFEFGRHPEDMYLIEEISHVAPRRTRRSSPRPAPELFGLDGFTDLSGKPRDLAKIFDTVEYAKWKSFRASEDSRYVGLAMPHVLGRLPYGPDTDPSRRSTSSRTSTAPTTTSTCGATPRTRSAPVTDAFAKYGWCAAIRGVEGGGLVEGLPTHTFRHRRRRSRAEVPDRDRDHRPPREGTRRPRLHPAGALQEHRLRRVLLHPVGAEGQGVQHRRGQRQCAPVLAAAVHLRGRGSRIT